MSALDAWLVTRLPLSRKILTETLQEKLPVRLKSWVLCLGGTPLLVFLILVSTGALLAFYYVPHPAHAYQSLNQITYEIRLGWFVRGMHRAAAHLMVLTVLLHMMRVFFTGAYRKPRELNWMAGVVLLVLVLACAFTGYSLVYDELSFWATTVGTNIAAQTPFIGEELLYFLRGGAEVNANTLTRFFYLHAALLPAGIAVLLTGHLALVRVHRPAGSECGDTYPFFPDHILREIIIGLTLLICLVNFAVFFPPELGPAADPFFTPADIRPEWYFFPVYRWLKMVPLRLGIWTSYLVLSAILFWPFIDALLERIAPGKFLGKVVGCIAILCAIALFTLEALSI